ncbi:short-chain dehydrogenase [Dactylonectria macrodidyma]|uniref:Short-chain dehydrogenase n=1 Tax=Dactylonectria macrodidyma TaxID=307937 RepID=A0A9P9DVC2_9HYPO|nr:short-chain dehydrogenase [Dactylonectria macrodidyma]
MSSSQTILITGANRGIGHGIASALLQKPSTTIIAAVRDPSKESSVALAKLPKGDGSHMAVESDPAAAVETLHSGTSVLQTSSSAISDHIAINTTGPIILLQATTPLLKVGNNPSFIDISSMGSIGVMEHLAGIPAIMSPYGGSKGALNWFLRRVHFEEPWLTTFVVHPGLVLTDMTKVMFENLQVNPKAFGAISVEQSVNGLMERVAAAKRDISGTFQNYDGTPLPW